ncbi:hypothetical protein B0T26DRAFT_646380 [Lasiosphaeria miniovina]|uniref:Uncharacterized protein n=1 Tax=Lasiosphaeria miniovina TaxID=1954250 RepID=A0AA40ALW9_9PEZI|nr:uncharacterized protein B0T26DRAFT_646380 [Lasiosphaeria miniovina]KAK0718229.1 hypothetical protein B0T26DRAFT_646380 [Lasiosphaeria miniovina]
MAQRGAGEVASNGGADNAPPLTALAPDELHQIRQYEKVLKFRDEVITGSHPRIKPSHLPTKPPQGVGTPPVSNAANSATPAASQPVAKPATLNGGRRALDDLQSFQGNLQRPSVNMAPRVPGLDTLSSSSDGPSRPFGSGKPEINPVLLEKSDDLIKAEIQLQRKRVEQGLKEQLEQRRAALRASLQASEQLAELNITEVMARALADALTAQSTDDTPVKASANASASSDSFDDNTFYSSQVDTPQSHQLSRVPLPDESDDEQMRDASPYEPELDPQPIHQKVVQVLPDSRPLQTMLQEQNKLLPNTTSPANAPRQPDEVSARPGLSGDTGSAVQAFRPNAPPETTDSRGSGVESRSGESSNMGMVGTADRRDLARVSEQLLSQAGGFGRPPVVRAHDLSPVAPQPAHVSPLAIARQNRIDLSDAGTRRATPAQVAALRKQTSAASSPESSPQGSRGAEKKKNKKNKRKAGRLAADVAATAGTSSGSPYIKPEPRSRSPVTAPYARPNKRQRQLQQQNSDFNFDHRYDQQVVVDDGFQEPYPAAVHRERRAVGYGREDDSRPRHDPQPIIVDSPRYERVYYDEARTAPPARQVRPDSPDTPSAPYFTREVRAVRPVPHVVEAPYGDSSAYYHDARAPPGMAVRPPAYRERSPSLTMYERPPPAMAPPQPAPARIIVDSFGREYLEPPRSATGIRDDSERLYERAPIARAASRRPELFEDDAVVYRPASPSYGAPRRVVTQPEFSTTDSRIYRERGHPSHPPMAPPAGEYVQSRGRLEGREIPREYIARSASTRPPVESIRYDNAAGYEIRATEERSRDSFAPRAASVRPAEGVRYEMPVAYERRLGDEMFREYATVRSASVRPGGVEPIRYEVAREYGTRLSSARPDMPGREYASVQYQAGQRDIMQPPPTAAVGRAYSVLPSEAPPQVIRRDYSVQPSERFYGRPQMQNDEEVIFLDRPPHDAYRELR